ncbi:MAG TPA: chorismate-binding protein [Sphingomonadales bacterium]|nr:chorismate-binding protein [Sphingomonadales bacterium]
MFDRLSLTTFKTLATAGAAVAVHREIPGDKTTPVGAYLALGEETKGAALLESSLTGREGRFSFLHFGPVQEIRTADADVTISGHGRTQRVKNDPFSVLRGELAGLPINYAHPLARFSGGYVGYAGYDCVRYLENIPSRHPRVSRLPDFLFRRYRDALIFDHELARTVITTVIPPEQATAAGFREAERRIEAIGKKLAAAPPELAHGRWESVRPRASLAAVPNDTAYERAAVKAKEYIRRGDAFQVVLARAFEVRTQALPFDIYRALRFVNPSPFMFFLDGGEAVVLGASPEKLIGLDNGALSIAPLAGTRPRRTGTSDRAAAEELLANPKERAEHMMLVDLARNDMGAIAVPGSVKVKELMKVQRFSHVLHISSAVEGTLEKGFDAVDALTSAFPAGTLTGAPKIRAMEIIDELESARRGFYGGAVCAFDAAGGLNSCIAIRAAVIEDGQATVRAGAGIVADSDPAHEAAETRHKAQAVLDAIALAERSLP